jgi:nucleotide-binding universal stress UspA family protein
MKNILLLVHDDAGQEPRLQAALDLTRLVEGQLTCVDVTILPPVISGDIPVSYGTSLLLQDEMLRESANRVRLEQRLAGESVSWDWVDATGHLVDCLAQAAGLSDVIVVNRRLSGSPALDMRSVASELVIKADKPILAVPDTLQRMSFDNALVLWDGSPCSVTALRAAVPLLKFARRVVLFEAMDGSVRMPSEDGVAYLARENVAAEIRRVRAKRFEASDLVLEEAKTGGHGYVVMGGFGHLRLIEGLFGGVSWAMLTHSPLPLFMAH